MTAAQSNKAPGYEGRKTRLDPTRPRRVAHLAMENTWLSVQVENIDVLLCTSVRLHGHMLFNQFETTLRSNWLYLASDKCVNTKSHCAFFHSDFSINTLMSQYFNPLVLLTSSRKHWK